MSEASYQAMHSVGAFGSHTCHHSGTYLYITLFKPLPPCCVVSGSYKHLNTDLFLSRLIIFCQEAANTISHFQEIYKYTLFL